MRLSDATTHFIRQLAANGCSLNTQKAYARDLGAFARWSKTPFSGVGENVQLSAIKPNNLARLLVRDAVLPAPQAHHHQPHQVGPIVWSTLATRD